MTSSPPTETAKRLHPLHEIAKNPTYKLLLKQWLKEEDQIYRRVALKETQLDSIRQEITALSCAFFIFHSFSLLLLFSASARDPASACRRSWIPCLFSLFCSIAIVWAIRYKFDTEAHLEKLLEREAEDGLLLGKCVEELKIKGAEFDLLKEVDALRRAKSLRIGLTKRSFSGKDLALLFFCAASFAVLGFIRHVLCGLY